MQGIVLHAQRTKDALMQAMWLKKRLHDPQARYYCARSKGLHRYQEKQKCTEWVHVGDRIGTGISFLDFFFHGGFQVPGFVHVYGEPGTGKSTLGYHLVKTIHHRGENTIWLDFNASFSAKRLLTIIKDVNFIDSLTLINVTSQSYLLTVLPTIISMARNARLLILDNFTYFYQLSDTEEKQGEFYRMYRQLLRLSALLNRNKMLGVLINQVRSSLDGEFYPVGGQLLNDLSRYVLAITNCGDHCELTVKKGDAIDEKLFFSLIQDGWSLIQNVKG